MSMKLTLCYMLFHNSLQEQKVGGGELPPEIWSSLGIVCVSLFCIDNLAIELD